MPAREPGSITRWFSTLQNITAQKRAAEAMRKSQGQLERFRLALDNSADMVLIIDRVTMRHVDVNQTACKLLGYTREELLLMGPEDILPLTREELEKTYDELIEKQSPSSGMRSHYRCRDGSSLPFESTRHVFRSGDSWLVAVISRDIRERIASERAARKKRACVFPQQTISSRRPIRRSRTSMAWRAASAAPAPAPATTPIHGFPDIAVTA